MMLTLYRLLTACCGPALTPYLRRRLQRGKEHPDRFQERHGMASLPRPAGRLVWLHGASVGEALSLLPLMERLHQRPGWSVLLTTGTVTSARIMAQRLPPGVLHQFVPVDHPLFVRRFLDHWRPDLAIWCESDFWPNLLLMTAGQNVPMVLVQGRMSPRSFARWRLASGSIRRLLGCFHAILAQTPEDADRLQRSGGRQVRYVGNLKLVARPLPVRDDDLRDMKQMLGDRPCWLAASTHAGEEILAARLHRALAVDMPGLVTLIAPRHPERGAAIAADIRAMGLNLARRSLSEPLMPDTQIYLADTMGELGLFYRLAPLVFVGKSLLAKGGQNPFEPALLGATVLFGPHMDNFPRLAPDMVQAGAACQVGDEAELQQAIGALLTDKQRLAEQRQQSLAWACGQAGVLDAVDAALTPFLEQSDSHAGP